MAAGASVRVKVLVTGGIVRVDNGGGVVRCDVGSIRSEAGIRGRIEYVCGMGSVYDFRMWGSWSGRLLSDLLNWLRWGRLIGWNCEVVLVDYWGFRYFRSWFWMAGWRMLFRNKESGLLSDGNLWFLAETGYSRGGLYTGCSITNFISGLVFVFPRQGDVFVDGFNGSIYMLG